MKKLAVLLVAVGSTMLFNARDAHALGAEVGGDIGYGLKPFHDGYDPNPYGFGLGLHGGVEISSFYLGASFRYFLGASKDVTLPLVGVQHVSINALQVGAELGYQVTIGPVTLRPYVWGGPTIYTGTLGSASTSSTHVTLAPAGHVHVKVFGPAFVGADVRYNFLIGNKDDDFTTQLTIMGSLGVAF